MEEDRIILLMDVDCFEVQVYQKADPSLRGKPCVVTNHAGRIVSVSYEARPSGVSRGDKVFQRARAKCPRLENIKMPEAADSPGHPDYTMVRQATNEIVEELRKFINEQEVGTTPVFQYSSRDEFYLDVTSLVNGIIITQGKQFPSKIIDLWSKSIVETPSGSVEARDWKSNSLYEIKLFYGLGIGSMLVEKIKENVGFQVSVGVGCNKLIAKLACGLNKPAAVTLILPYALLQVGKRTKIEDVGGLGSKHGEAIKQQLGVTTMHDLSCKKVSDIAEVNLASSGPIGKYKAQAIFNSVHGICKQEVEEKWAPNSIMTSALYRGKCDFEKLMRELRFLIKTILQRADEELWWRQRIPLEMKLIIRRFRKDTISCRLNYPVDVQNADEILVLILDQMGLDETWEDDEPLQKLELLAQPFCDVDVDYY